MKKNRSSRTLKPKVEARDLSKAFLEPHPSLDFEIVKEGVKGVFEGGKWVYQWSTGQSPLVFHIVGSFYGNKHHVVAYTVRNISPHGAFIEDIVLRDSMQIAGFAVGSGLEEPKPLMSDGVKGEWMRFDMNPERDPTPLFEYKTICPVYIPALESVSFEFVIKPRKNKKWATADFILSPLSGKNVLQHSEVFRLRDR
jgi:hypothetical protein